MHPIIPSGLLLSSLEQRLSASMDVNNDWSCIVRKYVPCDSVLRCLDLAGYTTIHVICRVDDSQLNDIERFVRETCAMLTESERVPYVGLIFAKDPSHFRFPGGVRCGLLLAVAEIREAVTSLSAAAAAATTQMMTERLDKGSQTDLTLTTLNSLIEYATHCLQPSSSHMDIIKTEVGPMVGSPETPLLLPESVESIDLPTHIENSPLWAECPVEIDYLKQHSSASIIRLAAQQFATQLVKVRDFDMEMEVSKSPAGRYRATGIFYCHLCRPKRDRSCPVRFSIARNRYPVVSNVLSHLKIHFKYRNFMQIVPSSSSSTSSPSRQHLAATMDYQTVSSDSSVLSYPPPPPHLPVDMKMTPDHHHHLSASRSVYPVLTPPDSSQPPIG